MHTITDGRYALHYNSDLSGEAQIVHGVDVGRDPVSVTFPAAILRGLLVKVDPVARLTFHHPIEPMESPGWTGDDVARALGLLENLDQNLADAVKILMRKGKP